MTAFWIKYSLEDRKIHISCIKEKKKSKSRPAWIRTIQWSSTTWVLPLAPLSAPSNALATLPLPCYHSCYSGLAALISLSALPTFPFGNTCSSFVYIPPFSCIALTFTNWGFHKLLGREGKLEKVGLVMANGNSMLELQNLNLHQQKKLISDVYFGKELEQEGSLLAIWHSFSVYRYFTLINLFSVLAST